MSNSEDVQANKGMAIIAYILFFVPLIAGTYKTSPYVKYHTNQGTALFVSMLAYGVASGILGFVLGFIPIIGGILIWLVNLCSLALVALMVLGIVNAANGVEKPLPVIGSIQIIR
ncbi:MAG: hypothetical protein LBI99_10960 [Propionibacteriaceae bacterium]|jgi:uncharacterized membrane protein|nr:hypothetical protein [Propionibacteriaceae bacterium]